MKAGIYNCNHCGQEQVMFYNEEHTKECAICGYITRTFMCGNCRNDITIIYSNDSKQVELSCPYCKEEMWLELGIDETKMDTVHLGFRNVTDNK